MPGLIETCQRLFDTSDLYEVLNTSKTSTENELKKAYHKVSLKVHPDRASAEDKEEATKKFQALSHAYSVLADKDRRAVYDETGDVDDENDPPADRDWNDYWRLLFKKITPDDIKNFEKEYKESEEELNDLKQAYMDGEGSMEYIHNNVLCAVVEDEPRFRKIINKWIKNEDVPAFDAFTKDNKKAQEKRKRKAAAEAEEAEEMKRELGLGNTEDSLKALILQRNKQRQADSDSFLDALASKYGGSGGKKKSSKSKK